MTRLMRMWRPAPIVADPSVKLRKALATQTKRVETLTTQRDLLKVALTKAEIQNHSRGARIASFISDQLIILLEKQNRLEQYLFGYAYLEKLGACDLIVAHHFDSLQTALALKAQSGGRIKVLFDCVEHPVHTLRTPGLLAYYFEDHPIRNHAHQVINDDMIRQCDGVIYTSPGHEAYLTTLGVPTRLVYNSKAAQTQSKTDRSLRQDAGAKDTDHVVLFLNHVYPRGGFDEFMDMVASFKTGYQFAFLGVVRGHDWIDKFDAARTGPFANRVTQLDLERPNRIVDYIGAADCLLCSFDIAHEGYAGLIPIRFFDALMAGVPIIAPENSQVGMIVEEYGIGVTYRAGAHLTAVRAACEMKKTKMFQANSAKARAVFGWETVQNSFLQAVRDIVPDVGAAHVMVLANKPLRNHVRTHNFARSLHGHCARADVVGVGLPDDELIVDGVAYHDVSPI